MSFSLSRAIGGGISFDGSMGPAATLSGPNFIIPASMGTQVGGNLFHSFGQFNLLNGETANFTATGSTAPIGNIIARVTGGSASSIDGTIESSITGANLFLLNPSGVMFGANAKVDVTGAFTTGTPDYVKMADGVGRFDTSLGGNDVLTSAAVSAFGFLGSTPQPVQFGPSNITLATGSNFTVIGGAITLDGATLTAPAGNVSFFSANSSGELAFDPASPSAHFNTSTLSSFGNVTLQNSSKVAIDSAQGGGSVMIRGGALVMQNASSITSINSGNSAGGAISVTGDSFQLTSSSTIATEALSGGGGGNINLTFSGAAILNAQGTLSANTLGAGAGGQVALQAGSLSVDGVGTQISSESKSGAAGDSGIVSVKAIEAISVTNGGIITADTSSSGSAGAVSVQADSLTIDGSGATGLFTGISSSCNQGATADAMGGLVSIDVVQALSISGGGAISASTFSAGNAGDIHILAGSLTIDGRIDGSSSVASFTGIASDCEKNSLGNGGNISLNVDDDIEIMNGGTINADTAAFGHAGAITVAQAGSLDIDGAGAIGQFTGISSVSDAGATGAGGTMSLNITSAITIEGTGAIEADTFSSGAAGEISLRAGSMTIDGSIDPNGLTGISSNADPSSSNTGGDVMVNITNDLICTGGGGIDSQAFATGHGGEVSVTVGGNLSLTDGGYVDADTYAAGNGGTLAVSAQSIFIDGAGSAGMGFSTGVNSDSSAYYNADATGNGGSVNVTAYQSLNMINGGTISASTETRGNGGDVVVNVPGSISLSGGAQITAASSSSSPLAGKAGSVVINAGNIELNDASRIATSALAVDAGAIDITSANGFYLMNGSSVTTSAGIDGGDISMTVGSLIYLLDSEITSEAHGGSGTQGGNISMDPDFVVLDNSPVSANDLLGKGGNILVLSNYMFNPDNSMTATGVSDGVVSTPPPDLDLGRTLVLEKPELVKAENQLRERCAEAINHEFSSLVVVGRGGIEGAPEELQPDFGMEATSAPVGNFAKAKP